ncbi:MAG TPA: ATPase, T2SS/T4P/T4SS family [Gemmatimonadaceae bacterium]|jgi:general secretion pathway protein E|nr:ATPase, T2SS/T4P/T4SS family [Gemmatimonadaceae bacterium]
MAVSDIRHSATELLEIERLTTALSADWLEQYGVLPLRLGGDVLAVGTWLDLVEPLALDDLRLLFAAGIALERFDEHDLRTAIRRLYAPEAATAEGVIAGMTGELPGLDAGASADLIPLDDLLHLANEAPVVRLVNLLLIEALDSRASDVHLEAYQDGLRVRYRVDGVLQNAPSPPPHLTAAIISRLKIMAELDIAERRLPQDGRIRLRLQNRQVDVRVSTVPTLRGESVVLRLLDKERGRISLTELGMAADTLELFTEVVSRPHGIVLVTGPTGSGKTTTLYAAVEMIRTGREKILTVEDPVEYELTGVPQVPVNEKVGMTFAGALRALLRQDPDIILVGEIRDAETAQIATQAALTGHLVLSTLHTNDAPTALTRLLDLDIAAYLVASTVDAVLAQRLVRVICRNCRTETRPDKSVTRRLDVEALGLTRVWKGAGCDECRNTGYRGRTGVYELLVMDGELRLEIQRRRGSEELRSMAVAKGMRTLLDDGVRAAREGITTVEEILRVARA